MNIKQWLAPSLSKGELFALFEFGMLGVFLAASYGILHDQVTYSISPEYFTRFKFEQFTYTDFGLGERVRVGLIGFFATWWVGLIVAWVLGRVWLKRRGKLPAKSEMGLSLLRVLCCALLGGCLGAGYAWYATDAVEFAWNEWRVAYGIKNLAAFAMVGSIHNGGYLGALLGLLLEIAKVPKP